MLHSSTANPRVRFEESQIKPGSFLVVSEDSGTRRVLTAYLEQNQCAAVGAACVDDAVRHTVSGRISCVILDVRSSMDVGFQMLRAIRSHSDIPLIMIASERQDEIDCVIGLELGADDYVTNPLNMRELLARARAILRRHEIGRVSIGPAARGGFRFAGWELRRRTRTLTNPEGRQVPLSKTEYALLIAFLESPGRPLSREHLLQATRTHEDIFDRSIDVQVLRLRKKIERDPTRPEMISTLRGVGYMLATSVDKIF